MVTHRYTSKSGALVGKNGVYSNSIIKIPRCGSINIGRDSSVCDIVISTNCSKISRIHCSISFDLINNYYVIQDFSTNGTVINNNGKKTMIKEQTTRAYSGNVIYIGNDENSFELL
jgi:pSer/pThr/pTyr-binding forkhead associated (FHA) protein